MPAPLRLEIAVSPHCASTASSEMTKARRAPVARCRYSPKRSSAPQLAYTGYSPEAVRMTVAAPGPSMTAGITEGVRVSCSVLPARSNDLLPYV